MYLAHGQARTDGNVGLDDPERFPLAFGFLSATQTTSKLSTITDVRHTDMSAGPKQILTIIECLSEASLAQDTTRRPGFFDKRMGGLWIQIPSNNGGRDEEYGFSNNQLVLDKNIM